MHGARVNNACVLEATSAQRPFFKWGASNVLHYRLVLQEDIKNRRSGRTRAEGPQRPEPVINQHCACYVHMF